MSTYDVRHKKYLGTAAAIFALLAGCFFLLLAVGSGRAADKADNESSRWIHFYRRKKLEAAALIASPKTVIIGGSTGFYGVDSSILSHYTGRPTLNYAIHAGLTLEYILYDARRVLKKGDTALLLLEYNHYVLKGDVSFEESDYVLAHDAGFLLHITPGRTMTMLASLPLHDWLQLIRRGIVVTPEDDSRYGSSIGPTGDITLNTDESAENKSAQRAAYKANPFVAHLLTRHAKQHLAGFFRWAELNGVKVMTAYPPYMRFEEYETGRFQLLLEDMRSFYAREGIEMIGSAREHLYPREFFFDTNCHLKASARTRFSHQLGREIQMKPVQHQ